MSAVLTETKDQKTGEVTAIELTLDKHRAVAARYTPHGWSWCVEPMGETALTGVCTAPSARHALRGALGLHRPEWCDHVPLGRVESVSLAAAASVPAPAVSTHESPRIRRRSYLSDSDG